jgi:hypothetical protein
VADERDESLVVDLEAFRRRRAEEKFVPGVNAFRVNQYTFADDGIGSVVDEDGRREVVVVTNPEALDMLVMSPRDARRLAAALIFAADAAEHPEDSELVPEAP